VLRSPLSSSFQHHHHTNQPCLEVLLEHELFQQVPVQEGEPGLVMARELVLVQEAPVHGRSIASVYLPLVARGGRHS